MIRQRSDGYCTSLYYNKRSVCPYMCISVCLSTLHATVWQWHCTLQCCRDTARYSVAETLHATVWQWHCTLQCFGDTAISTTVFRRHRFSGLLEVYNVLFYNTSAAHNEANRFTGTFSTLYEWFFSYFSLIYSSPNTNLPQLYPSCLHWLVRTLIYRCMVLWVTAYCRQVMS